MSDWEPNAAVVLLDFEHAVAALRADLAAPGPCLLYAYLIDPVWFDELFAPHLAHSLLQILADARQRPMLRSLSTRYPKIRAATWSTNRTMHDKTLIFPQTNLVYLTTANITRGSWSLSMNNVARIHSPQFTRRLETEFHTRWQSAHSVPKFKEV